MWWRRGGGAVTAARARVAAAVVAAAAAAMAAVTSVRQISPSARAFHPPRRHHRPPSFPCLSPSSSEAWWRLQMMAVASGPPLAVGVSVDLLLASELRSPSSYSRINSLLVEGINSTGAGGVEGGPRTSFTAGGSVCNEVSRRSSEFRSVTPRRAGDLQEVTREGQETVTGGRNGPAKR